MIRTNGLLLTASIIRDIRTSVYNITEYPEFICDEGEDEETQETHGRLWVPPL